jgi:hypothetical protein
MPEGINDTIIVLIPKVTNPEQLADFRPISLCNVVYKVISKCLVNRLHPFLDGLISETQSAFIPGRMITDNAILAFEGFHKIQHSKNPLNTHCAFKLDLSKAYDRVDWNFLEGVLVKMGFSMRWVNWIMTCILETHRDLPPSLTRDQEGPEALPGTLPERGIATRDLLHRHACLRRDE